MEKIEKIMTFIVATNIVASRPAECQPTETPHARANRLIVISNSQIINKIINQKYSLHLKMNQ